MARARHPKGPEEFWEDYCFEAQQAAEKALKAVLIARGSRFRKTHDIGVLLTLLREAGVEVPTQLDEATHLTKYAFESRYPSELTVREEGFAEALRLAVFVVGWCESQLK